MEKIIYLAGIVLIFGFFILIAIIIYCKLRELVENYLYNRSERIIDRYRKRSMRGYTWYPKGHPMKEIHEIICDRWYMTTEKRDRIMELLSRYYEGKSEGEIKSKNNVD